MIYQVTGRGFRLSASHATRVRAHIRCGAMARGASRNYGASESKGCLVGRMGGEALSLLMRQIIWGEQTLAP